MELKRIVIAEDDPQQAQALAGLVAQFSACWHVDAIVHSRAELEGVLDSVRPDLLLLDLHMPGAQLPGMSPLDIVRKASVPPVVILVTADPSQALFAFDNEVVDYVVKPVRPTRFGQALQRADDMIYARRVAAARASPTPAVAANSPRWLTGVRGRDVVPLDPNEILYLQAERKYTIAVLAVGQVLVRHGIGDVAANLDEALFKRVHRSTIVNIKRVDFMRRDEMGRFRVHLKDRPETLVVSKPFEQQFKVG
ncbi:LytR/AlgR family response regulator transcription factor [Polaromonas sp. CT11-55]|uniref:LytR/AlgR family response regulator transcription factor n=1 Tax=Polaromonas sp. CT11-55 TaxID=3243045 RepID=UPI0039A51AE2